MILCWDNINNVKITKNNRFRHISRGSVEFKDNCLNFNDPFIGKKKDQFCSPSCLSSHNNIIRGKHSTETKNKISNTRIERGVVKGDKILILVKV
jgi:hypothetical protein